MNDQLISIAFWALLPIGCLLTGACLIGIIWRDVQFTAARWYIDDGAEEGTGYEVYKLYLASERLARFSSMAAAALAAAGLAGALGPATFKLASIVALIALALAADGIRVRHARLESRFERTVGESLGSFCRRINENAVRA